jgi:lipopolysaccharide assembly protein A
MTRILLILLLVAVLVLGATVGYFNAQTVRFDFLFGAWDLPLIALLIAAFALGVLIALAVAAGRIFALRLEIRRLRQRVHNHEVELRSLRELPLGGEAGGGS